MRLIDADALLAECELAQKQAVMDGREFANAFYSGGGEVSTEWWCVEDMIENAKTIEPEPVVRCRECIWLLKGDDRICEDCVCDNAESPVFATDEDFGCIYGEQEGAGDGIDKT